MDRCRECGTPSQGQARCPSCGAPRDSDEEPPGNDERAASELALAEPPADAGATAQLEVEPAPVPAGTWASESTPETPSNPFERAPETRRVRRLPADEPAAEARAQPMGMAARTARGAVLARARARGLAVAPRPDEPPEPSQPPSPRPGARQGRVVAFPGSRAAPAATASSSGLRPNAPSEPPPVPQPRFLASELLRERTPAEPYAWTSRAVGIASGVAGASASAALGSEGPDLAAAALFTVIALLGTLPVSFTLRASGFAVLASIGLAITTWARAEGPQGESVGLATMGTTLLAAAQLLRAVHRSSKFARGAMVVGLVSAGAWLWLGGGLEAMVVHGTTLEAWLGPATRATLLVVLALSLLAFVDPSGTSGTQVWPWLVLGWCAFEAGATIVVSGPERLLPTAATPLFSAVAALGWMQVWASTPGLGGREARAATP